MTSSAIPSIDGLKDAGYLTNETVFITNAWGKTALTKRKKKILHRWFTWTR